MALAERRQAARARPAGAEPGLHAPAMNGSPMEAAEKLASGLSAAGNAVRRHDPDRFLTALFAPAQARETLFLLYAFNHELARAREVASEPTPALIRLQWWREVVEGVDRRHELATPLRQAISGGQLDPAALLGLIEGREREAEEAIPDLAAWQDYLRATAGGVMAEAGRVLGADAAAEPPLRALGAAYGAAGVLRSVGILARQGRCLLPADVLAAHALTPEAVIAAPGAPSVRSAVAALAAGSLPWLEVRRGLRLPRSARAAALPAVLARRDLRRAARGAPSPAGRLLGDRVAVLAAGFGGWPGGGFGEM
jgi:15-cis-phytoene synthase